MAAGRSRSPSGIAFRGGERAPASWGPRQVEAARPLLFERLTGIAAGGEDAMADGALYGKAGLMASIERELDALFNTRAPVAANVLDQRQRTTIDYGIPDLSLYAADDSDARTALAAQLAHAVTAYEPRLHDPKVRVLPHPARERQLIAAVEGTIRLDTLVEHVSFRIALPGATEPDDGG
jgi:type VI secretion system lysozyme-like protein